ncbi:MAG: glycosyltransferase [Gemmatimonadaceae bacterium]
MLYLAIPAHNEAATIGVLLWRLRTVLAEFPREYEAVVYDDASNDSTSEILESYARVMPLTVLRGERKVGYAGAVDALVRHVARHTRYPRRDAMLLLQGDFTDSPQLVPEFVKRFEGGTDVVVGERGHAVRRKAPTPVRRLMRAEPWLLRFFVKAEGIRDLTSSYRLIRISVLRDLLRTVGDAAVCVGDARTANADLLMRIVPLARRVEGLPVEPTWEVRQRETRVDAMADGMNLLKWAWRSRGQKAVPSTAPEVSDAPRHGRPSRDGRTESASDVAITVAESGRGSLRDTASRTRKSKPVRGEGRTEGRSENRDEKRPEGRAEARNDQRPSRNEGRPARTDARAEPRREAEPKLVATDVVDEPNAGDDVLMGEAPVRERPPRRKRTRGGRRDAPNATAVDGAEFADSNESAARIERSAEPSDSLFSDNDPSDASRVDIELSPALSEAVADAEAELDVPGHTRPARKKRRRRGGRGGRAAGQLAGDDESASDGDDADSGSSEATFDSAHAVRPNADRSVDSDAGDGDSAAEFSGGDDADGAEGGTEDGQERVRRRGRRGRRGGSRRSRSARGEAAGEFSDDAGSGAPGGDSVGQSASDASSSRGPADE